MSTLCLGVGLNRIMELLALTRSMERFVHVAVAPVGRALVFLVALGARSYRRDAKEARGNLDGPYFRVLVFVSAVSTTAQAIGLVLASAG